MKIKNTERSRPRHLRKRESAAARHTRGKYTPTRDGQLPQRPTSVVPRGARGGGAAEARAHTPVGVGGHVVDEDAHAVAAGVGQLEEVGADLHHLAHAQVRGHGQLLGEQHAVHQLHGGQHGRPLLVGLDLLHRGHEARRARGQDAVQRAVAVLGVVAHRALLLLLLVHEVEEVELELGRGWEGRNAHAHDLPALGDGVGGGVAAELLHDLEVDLVAELGLLQALLENVLGQGGGEGHGLVAHVPQQRLVDLHRGLGVVRLELGEGPWHERVLPLEHALLELALLKQHALGEVVGRPQRRVVAEGVLLLLGLGVALLGLARRVLVGPVVLQGRVLRLALLLVLGVQFLAPFENTHRDEKKEAAASVGTAVRQELRNIRPRQLRRRRNKRQQQQQEEEEEEEQQEEEEEQQEQEQEEERHAAPPPAP